MRSKQWGVVLIFCIVISCSLSLVKEPKPTAVQLDGVEISCVMPKKGYSERERQIKDDLASVTIECPTLITSGGYSVIPVFSMVIEKADSLLDPVAYNNRSRAVYEAKTIAVLSGSQRLLGGEFTESVQQQRFGAVQNTIYQATTAQNRYGIRIVYQVPSEVYAQGFGEIQQVIKTARISSGGNK